MAVSSGSDSSSTSGWTVFMSHLSSFLVTNERQFGIANEHYTEYALDRLTHICQIVDSVTNMIHAANVIKLRDFVTSLTELYRVLLQITELWREHKDGLDMNLNSSQYTAPLEPRRSGAAGRARFAISKEQLQYLRSLFSWTSISQMLMVSRMTVYRRRMQYGLLDEPNSRIDNQDLKALVQRVIIQHPHVGQSFVCGHVRSLGYIVTRERVRQTLRMCDPINTALRWGGISTTRQPYSVPGPNSLWHIDGNHKLIRWRLVFHSGFSRMIVFLKCSSNNRANTVYDLFTNAADRFGLPSRVRSDFGGENCHVARYMVRRRGTDRGSMLTGSSTHNQRIERLWVDLYRSVTILYYRLFYFLEQRGLLDALNEAHLFALHYVFIPRINKAVQSFQDGWNHHGIRTAGHSSPQQLFVQGALRLRSSGLVALDFFDSVDSDYGVSVADPFSSEQVQSVFVPESAITLQVGELSRLHSDIILSKKVTTMVSICIS